MRFAFSLSLAIATAGFVAAQPAELPPLLEKAIERSEMQRYTGTRVIEFRRGPDMVRHEEVIIRDGKRVRIEFPAGSIFAGQIIVEDGKDRRHFFPDRKEIRVLPIRRDEMISRLKRLGTDRQGRKRTFTDDGTSSVAGVPTRQISVKDANGNVLQRMQIEPKSGLMLKRILFDPGGAPVGSFEFTKINLRPKINPSVFTLVHKGAKVVTPLDDLRQAAAQEGFLVRSLAPSTGYEIEWAMVIRPKGKPVLMQVLNNQGRKVTLYQVGTPVDAEELKRMGRGWTTSHSWQQDGRWFVIVGSMAQSELETLASSLTDRL